MASTDGLRRGTEAVDTGQAIAVPVGEPSLGRLFNVLGEPLDNLGPVNAEETWLEGRLPEMRAAAAGPAAIITLPSESDRFDAPARRAVLDHEIAHGRFFTDPAFAAHVLQAWRDTFTEADRNAFRRFLAREGYELSALFADLCL